MFNIQLQPQEIDTIIAGLDQLPHGQVKELDVKLRIQAQQQIEAMQRKQAEAQAAQAAQAEAAAKAAAAAEKASKKAVKAKPADPAPTPAAEPEVDPLG